MPPVEISPTPPGANPADCLALCRGCEAGAEISHGMFLQAMPGAVSSGGDNRGHARVQNTRNVHAEKTGSRSR